MPIGKVTLYVNGEYICERQFHSTERRKEIMKQLENVYALKNKEHYWQVLFEDVTELFHIYQNNKTIYTFI